MKKKTLAVALCAVFVLAACGGGDGNGGSSSSGSPSNGGTSSGGGGNGGSTTTSSLKPTQYTLYKPGTQDALSGGAGTVSNATANGGTLSLDVGNTVLTVTDPAQFSMSASGYYITNRAQGSVIMLCDSGSTLGSNTKSRYVGAALTTSDGTNQAVQVTNSADLAGQTLYNMEDCSYQNNAGNPQGQNSAPDSSTSNVKVDASGNATFSNGTPALTAAQFTALLSGGAVQGSQNKTYFTAYKVGTGASAKYVIVERGIPNTTANVGYVGMWITN